MKNDPHILTELVLKRDKRAVARAISLLENNYPVAEELALLLEQSSKDSWIIGVTGSPGAGKSSLVDQMIKEARSAGFTVGVIAVDPSSPFSGGAILGDRIRMQGHSEDQEVFIRSMSSRGQLGGLSAATAKAVKVLAAAGYNLLIIETVGVGQSELDVMELADTTMVVLTPNMGDAIQSIKAGIMEIADIFVVNKADLFGADRVVTETASMLALSDPQGWQIPVLAVSSLNGTGFKELWQNLDEHHHFLLNNGQYQLNRQKRRLKDLKTILLTALNRQLEQELADPKHQELLTAVAEGKIPSALAAKMILNKHDSVC
ncbi:MAG: methylmalonyl Co-A mutase-associated GTPase MeaB [Clostridia bacterium]|nr:methylmalonyl Co-A mutase-associated GTPase MeaB [Clostridia bacterium]